MRFHFDRNIKIDIAGAIFPCLTYETQIMSFVYGPQAATPRQPCLLSRLSSLMITPRYTAQHCHCCCPSLSTATTL